MAVASLDDDEKGVSNVYTLGGMQKMLCINESGLYHLIFTSRKGEAKAFRKWVTSEVIPSIRKTGSYSIPQVEPLYFKRGLA
jgi:prophage antirepressor-like protein